MAALGEYRLVVVEPLLDDGYETHPLPTDRPTVVGFSPNAGTMGFTMCPMLGITELCFK
jgi:hypothetical protein